MKCYRCGGFLYESDHCPECGADVAAYKKTVKRSNEMYNQALYYARDRNLSGAIRCLEVSIKMYKANINARNLLGLIYVETGEYTLGLTQWVISRSFQKENNLAEYFLSELQNNRQSLNLMNVSIRKYNKAINYVQQGNYDLAEIQLKKLLNDNPNMLKGHQLLALLFIRRKKFAEARAALRKAEKIDRGNPLTISYLNHVTEEMKSEEKDLTPAELKTKRQADKEAAEEHTPLSGDDVIIPKSSYREYNPTTMTIIQIIIGVVIGAAIIFFAVTPAKIRSVRSEAEATQAELQARIDELESQLGTEGESSGTETETDVEAETSEEATDSTLEEDSATLIAAYAAYNSEDYDTALELMEGISSSSLSNAEFKESYDVLMEQLNSITLENLINEGLEYYQNEDYTSAAESLEAAYEQGADDENTLYFLGRSYDWLNDEENTLKYLEEYAEKYPEGDYITTVNSIISGWTN